MFSVYGKDESTAARAIFSHTAELLALYDGVILTMKSSNRLKP
jgi:hypothetical protein